MNKREVFMVSDVNPLNNINLEHCVRVGKTNYGSAFYIVFTTVEGREINWHYNDMNERDVEFNKITSIFGRKLSEFG